MKTSDMIKELCNKKSFLTVGVQNSTVLYDRYDVAY